MTGTITSQNIDLFWITMYIIMFVETSWTDLTFSIFPAAVYIPFQHSSYNMVCI